MLAGWQNNDSESKSDGITFNLILFIFYANSIFFIILVDDDNDEDYWGTKNPVIKINNNNNDFLPYQQPKKQRWLRPWKHKKRENCPEDSEEEKVVTIKRRR